MGEKSIRDREGAKKEREREDQGMFVAIYIYILPTIPTLPGTKVLLYRL